MARLPFISREELPADEQHVYDDIAQTRGSAGATAGIPHGYQALLNSPSAAEAVGRLGEYVRFHSSLDPLVREVAILSTARSLNSQYEWSHHEPIARQTGVPEDVVDIIKSGKAPMGLPAREAVYAQAAKELATEGTLGEKTFEAVLHLLGPGGTVELIVLVGYYALLASALSALDVELEPGTEPRLPTGD